MPYYLLQPESSPKGTYFPQKYQPVQIELQWQLALYASFSGLPEEKQRSNTKVHPTISQRTSKGSQSLTLCSREIDPQPKDKKEHQRYQGSSFPTLKNQLQVAPTLGQQCKIRMLIWMQFEDGRQEIVLEKSWAIYLHEYDHPHSPENNITNQVQKFRLDMLKAEEIIHPGWLILILIYPHS